MALGHAVPLLGPVRGGVVPGHAVPRLMRSVAFGHAMLARLGGCTLSEKFKDRLVAYSDINASLLLSTQV